jgi:hypothetical protein
LKLLEPAEQRAAALPPIALAARGDFRTAVVLITASTEV